MCFGTKTLYRFDLQRIRGAYVLQGAWRGFVVKKVRADKQRNRNQAATKIQALWKGFWIRSRESFFPDLVKLS